MSPMIHLSRSHCSDRAGGRDIHAGSGANPRCRQGLPTGSDDITSPKSSVRVARQERPVLLAVRYACTWTLRICRACHAMLPKKCGERDGTSRYRRSSPRLVATGGARTDCAPLPPPQGSCRPVHASTSQVGHHKYTVVVATGETNTQIQRKERLCVWGWARAKRRERGTGCPAFPSSVVGTCGQGLHGALSCLAS